MPWVIKLSKEESSFRIFFTFGYTEEVKDIDVSYRYEQFAILDEEVLILFNTFYINYILLLNYKRCIYYLLNFLQLLYSILFNI